MAGGETGSVPQRVLLALVRGYRLLFRGWLGGSCRFEPTCSAYALTALERHGAGAGTYLILHRLARCQPLCAGGCDPVPVLPPALLGRPPAHRSPVRRPAVFGRRHKPVAGTAAPTSNTTARPNP